MTTAPSALAAAPSVPTAPVTAPSAPALPDRAPDRQRLPEVRTSPLPADTLLGLARRGLGEATAADHPVDRYAAAHLAALRAAAAVLACRARPVRPSPTGRRSRPTSAWVLLAAVAPELGEWAEFFAAGARKRAAAEAGVPAAVTAREADDLLRDAERFLSVVETAVGAGQAPLPGVLDRHDPARERP